MSTGSIQKLKLAALACTLAAGLAACGGGGASFTAAPTQTQLSAAIWFHPLPAAAAWPGGNPNGGSTDFLALFQANAPWPHALAKTQVIGLYAGWITAIDDQDLQQFVAFLNAHNMGIEIEAPAMQAQASCGSGVEGYVPYGQSLHDFTLGYLQRLQSFGAPVTYIKVDEPFYFGTVVNDPRSCHFPVADVALAVGQFTQLVHSVYPNVAVGDVEPIIASAYYPDVVTAMGGWHDVFQSTTGAPFPFFFADIDFSNPLWPTIVKQLEDSSKQRGMRFGIIYIGDQFDTSDAEWASKTVARFQTYQGQSGGQPDYVLFQSWEPHPQYCLPESNPETFTGVIDAYINATT